MHTERIKQLRDFLNGLPQAMRTKHFSLEAWIQVDGMYDGIIRLDAAETPYERLPGEFYGAAVDPADIVQAHCGSTACAIGWACSNPVFNRLGFRMLARRELDEGTGKCDLTNLVPRYGTHEGWDAVGLFFELDNDTARTLFDADYYEGGDATALSDVINRLDELIETGTI